MQQHIGIKPLSPPTKQSDPPTDSISANTGAPASEIGVAQNGELSFPNLTASLTGNASITGSGLAPSEGSSHALPQYHRRDHSPWHARPLADKLRDIAHELKGALLEGIGLIKSNSLNEVVCRVKHMWSDSDISSYDQSDTRVSRLLAEIYERSRTNRFGYFGDVLYQYNRECETNKSPLGMHVELGIRDDLVRLSVAPGRITTVSNADYDQMSEALTKQFLSQLLTFVSTLRDDGVRAVEIQILPEQHNSLSSIRGLGWFNVVAGHQFGLDLNRGLRIRVTLDKPTGEAPEKL